MAIPSRPEIAPPLLTDDEWQALKHVCGGNEPAPNKDQDKTKASP